jgi:hypothetical protein
MMTMVMMVVMVVVAYAVPGGRCESFFQADDAEATAVGGIHQILLKKKG